MQIPLKCNAPWLIDCAAVSSTCLARRSLSLGSLSLMEDDGFVLTQQACPNRRQRRLKRFSRLFNALTSRDVNMI